MQTPRNLTDFAVAGNLARVPYPYRLADAKAWLKSWRPDRPAEDTGFTIDLPGEGPARVRVRIEELRAGS